ncbi:MAG: uroporphyrinogen-III synthase [Candidatus Verstraetearchaeota archaeon]|nr:uroporphyrinogen-III synthase [Candidatus Verstraetearchaeota archaeon]
MVQGTQTLKGRTVAITRPLRQAGEAAALVEEMGGRPYYIPAIIIEPPKDPSRVVNFIGELAEGGFDYVIFTSVNGVRHLVESAESSGTIEELKSGLGRATVVAIGPRTAQELELNGIRVGLVPESYTSEGLVEALGRIGVSGKKIGIPRTSAASPVLKEGLEGMGATVEEVYVYESKAPTDGNAAERFYKDLASSKIDAIVFGSSLCVTNLFRMLSGHAPGEELAGLLNSKTTVVAIGPMTANTLKEMGVEVKVMPTAHTFKEALVALSRHWDTK